MKTIEIPAELGSMVVVASVSGGKDSTALMLALRDAGVPFRAVFADTGWEAPETYAYLDTLREMIGPIDVVHPKRDMVESIRHRTSPPTRMARWCTSELKLRPLRAYHDALCVGDIETVSAMGIRADESESRAKMPMWADDDEWGGFVWRPLMHWTIGDVIDLHRRHNVPMNPLYHGGAERVGCYPCIFSRKEEIRLLPEWRIAEIEALEAETTAERARRNAETPGRYAHEQSTFFQTRDVGRVMGIREIHAWSRTERGGKQLPLLQPLPQGGCMRWGTCEAPPAEET
jgi:3'-phosphoadenosine 5'-phosphosulfate sulfotransferase (PAPS reductase)/FAD synthetase